MATNDKYELNVEGTEETGELNLTDETSRSLGLDVESSTENCVGLTMEDGTSNYLSLNLEDTILRSASEEGEEAREKAEAERRKNEVARISAEKTREDAEAIRVANEKKRVSAESARVTAETSRATAETSRVNAEKKRETAEATRTTQETARVTAEAKRVAEWEEIKKTISGVKFYVCKTGEYDATTKVPTLTGASGIIYLTPVSDATETQNYTEWLYVEDTKKFEKIGSSEVSVTPISTSTIDAIANGESKTGNEVATTTGLTYIFAKLKALFAPLTHTHKKADITDLTLGEADLTITQDSTTLGTFGANATTAKTIDIPSPTLTITQGGTTKGTYKPSSKTNTTIDLAQGTAFYICKSGEYDTTTLTPTLTGNSNTIYFVPLPTDAKGKSDNNSYAEYVYLESSKKFESICISPTAGSSDVNDGKLAIFLTHGTEGTYRTTAFTANQATDTSIYISSLPPTSNVTYGSYIVKDEGMKYKWVEPSISISSTSDNFVTGTTVNSHLVNNYAPKTHTHVSNDITDLGKGTLTIKANDEVKGTFGANATEDVTIDLGASGEVNDGVLTVKQGEATLGTFSANQKDASTITVPEPNNATLTIKAGETTKGSFSANAKDDVTIDIGEAIVNDGALTVKQGTETLGTFTANQASATTVNIPEEGKGTLTVKQGETSKGTFSANATADTTITLDEPNNATLTIKQGETTKGTFSANADTDVSVALDEVNDGTLTVKQGETTLGTFTANAKDASTITVPEPNNATLTVKAGTKTIGTFTANAKEDVTIDLGDTTINNGKLTIKQGDTTLGTFTANQASDSTVTFPEEAKGTLTLIQGTDTKGSFSANATTNKTITLDDAYDGTLTIKQGETTLGTFTANSKDSVNVAIPEPNNAKLTIQQEGETLQTFTANADKDATVNITHKTGSGYNHIPAEGSANCYLSWDSDGKAKWTETKSLILSDIGVYTRSDNACSSNAVIGALANYDSVTLESKYAKLKSPALTGTPTAPTATAGTNTTQIATTAYVMNLMKPTVILNGTDTNYVSSYNNRVDITNILLTKSGYNYSMDIKYTMNASAKSVYAAGDTWNVMSVGSTLKNLVGTNPCYGIFHDNASTGDYAGMALLTVSQNYLAISSIKQLTVVDSSVYHMLLTFISQS